MEWRKPTKTPRKVPRKVPGKVTVMRGRRFWAKNQDRRPESEMAGEALAGTLTAMDRCDRCGARAYVRVLLPRGLELLFCAHHTREHASALTMIAVEIRDETDRLSRVA